MPNKPRADNPARPVRFEDEEWQQVRELAKKRDTTASEIVRAAVRDYLERNEA